MLRATIEARVGSLAIRADFETERGPLVLVGPNGSGKTSLLLLLLGARTPSAGKITLNDELLFDSAAQVNVPLERRNIGYVPQHYGLFTNMNALENVAFALACKMPELSRGERTARARTLLARLDIEPLAQRRVDQLSGGEKQKVALVRALATQPRALLLDEPLAAMDVTARRDVRAFLRRYLAELGLPSVVVTHDPRDAASLSDTIAVFEQGRIAQKGSWSELRARPNSPFIEAFVSALYEPLP